jgi:hypothetical protein
MKYALVVALGAFLATHSVQAQSPAWVHVSEGNGFITSVNPTSIRKLASGERTAWFQRILAQPKDKVKRRIAKMRYRCDEEMSAIESQASYDLSGNVLRNYTYKSYEFEWEAVAPGTVGYRQLEVVCKWPI